MTLTKKLAISLHRKMWSWIADETERQKEIVTKCEYPPFRHITIDNDCWCCEYAQRECRNCPIEWNEKKHNDILGLEVQTCTDEEYRKWRAAVLSKQWQEAAHWARIIAELPEREQADVCRNTNARQEQTEREYKCTARADEAVRYDDGNGGKENKHLR